MNSLRSRLAWMSGAIVAVVLLSALALSYRAEREQQLVQAQRVLLQQQQRLASGLDAVFERTEQRAREIAEQIRTASPDRGQLEALLTAKLVNDGESVQLGVMLEPRNPVDSRGRLAISVVYAADGPHTMDYVQMGYPYWTMPWYRQTLESKNGWWSDPYFNDYAGGVDVVTFDYPLRDAAGTRLGMLSVSIALDRMDEIVAGFGSHRALAESGFLVVDAQGKLLLASDPRWRRAGTLTTNAAPGSLLAWVARQPAHAGARQGRSDDHARSFVQVPLPRVGWRLAAAVDDAEVLSDLRGKMWIAVLLALLLAVFVALVVGRSARYFLDKQAMLEVALEGLLEGRFSKGGAATLTRDWTARSVAVFQRLRQLQAEHAASCSAEYIERQRVELVRQHALLMQQEQLPEDRVFFGGGMQAHACGGVRMLGTQGGRFYGFVAVSGGFVFYLGTVAHGGPAPALQMGKLSSLLGIAARSTATPADMLDAVAGYVRQDDGIDFPSELLVGRVDLEKMGMTIANIGAARAIWLGGAASIPLTLPASGPAQRELHGRWQEWRGPCAADSRLLLGNWRAEAGTDEAVATAMQGATLPAKKTLDNLLAFAAVFHEGEDRAAMLLEIKHRD